MPTTTMQNPWADGIRSIGSAMFDPRARAEGALMRQRAEATALEAQKTQAELEMMQRRGEGERQLAELFRAPGAIVTDPSGQIRISPSVAPDFFSSYGQSRPNSPLMDAFDVMNRAPDIQGKNQFELQKQAAAPKTMSQVQAEAFGALTPAEQRLVVGPKPIPLQPGGSVVMPQGAESIYGALPQQGGQQQATADLFGTPAPAVSPEAAAKAQQLGTQIGEAVRGTPLAKIFSSLAQAQQAAPYAAGFSEDPELGVVPKAQMVGAGSGFSPYRDANGELPQDEPAASPVASSIEGPPMVGPQVEQMGGGVTRSGNVIMGPPKGSSVEAQARPKNIPQEAARGMTEDMGTINKIERAIALIEQNPDAVGLKNMLPDALIQRANPEGVIVRAALSEIGAAKLHDLSGAAVTVQEWARNRINIPNSQDTPEAALIKLKLMRDAVTDHLITKAKFYSPKMNFVMDPSVTEYMQRYLPKDDTGQPPLNITVEPRSAANAIAPQQPGAAPAAPSLAPQGTDPQAEARRAMKAIQMGANPDAVRALYKQKTGLDL